MSFGRGRRLCYCFSCCRRREFLSGGDGSGGGGVNGTPPRAGNAEAAP